MPMDRDPRADPGPAGKISQFENTLGLGSPGIYDWRV